MSDLTRQLAFVTSNLLVFTGCMVMALAILPRLRLKLNMTIYAGIAFFICNGLQHLYVTYGLLADKVVQVASSTHLLALRMATAVALTTFVVGVFLDVAKWKRLRLSMTSREDTPNDRD